MSEINNNKGITLLALAITIIVLSIIAGISINAGKQAIDQAEFQTIETNMLIIKAKAKSYAEEIEAATWALSDDEKTTERQSLFETNYFMTNIQASKYPRNMDK